MTRVSLREFHSSIVTSSHPFIGTGRGFCPDEAVSVLGSRSNVVRFIVIVTFSLSFHAAKRRGRCYRVRSTSGVRVLIDDVVALCAIACWVMRAFWFSSAALIIRRAVAVRISRCTRERSHLVTVLWFCDHASTSARNDSEEARHCLYTKKLLSHILFISKKRKLSALYRIAVITLVDSQCFFWNSST